MTKERAREIIKQLIPIRKKLEELSQEVRWPDYDLDAPDVFMIQRICHVHGFAENARSNVFEMCNYLGTAFEIDCFTGDNRATLAPDGESQ